MSKAQNSPTLPRLLCGVVPVCGDDLLPLIAPEDIPGRVGCLLCALQRAALEELDTCAVSQGSSCYSYPRETQCSTAPLPAERLNTRMGPECALPAQSLNPECSHLEPMQWACASPVPWPSPAGMCCPMGSTAAAQVLPAVSQGSLEWMGLCPSHFNQQMAKTGWAVGLKVQHFTAAILESLSV